MAFDMGALIQLLGQQQALGSLGKGYDQGVKRFDTNYYDPFTKAYAGAPDMLRDALGLGDADGTTRARKAFEFSPGYQTELDQGLTALDRRAASRGMLASGNNTQDTLDFAQGLARKEYGNWLDRLDNTSRLGMAAAEGQTGRQRSLADLDMGYGRGAADITMRGADRMADLMAPRQQRGGGLGGAIAGGLNLGGALLGSMYGGPAGGAAGGSLGSMLGNFFR